VHLCCCADVGWLIDPSGLRNFLSARFAGDESIGMRRIRGEHHVVSSGEDMRSASVMKQCRREQRDARVPMFVIVPIEELGTEPFAVFERTEAIGKARAILVAPGKVCRSEFSQVG